MLLIEWKIGLKAGFFSGIIYGVVKALAHFARYVSENAPGDFSGGALYYLTFLPLEILEGLLIGTLVGIAFALAFEQLPGKTTMSKGLKLSLFFFSFYFFVWLFNLYIFRVWTLPSVLRWSILLELRYQITQWIIVLISWVMFGISLGFTWKNFYRSHHPS